MSRIAYSTDNADTANKLNVKKAYDTGETEIDLGGGSDRFHFGNWDADVQGERRELRIDMGEGEAPGETKAKFQQDMDIITFRGTIDDYTFEPATYDGVEYLRVTNNTSGQVISFANWEKLVFKGRPMDGPGTGDKEIVMSDGDWKDALGIEPVGNNYIIDSDGVIRDMDMTSLNVSDDIAQNVTIVVDDEYATRFTETIKLGFGAKYGELFKALGNGSNFDVRTGRYGDDLELLLNEAFEDDGFDLGGGNMVGVQIVDMDTVKMSFTVGGVTDTVTVTGAYVDGYLDTMFDGKNAVIDDGVLVGLKAGAFDADDNVSENATLIVNIAGPDDIKFNFGTEIRNLVSDINKGEYLDHRDATDDLTYLVQAVFNPDDETVSDRVSGEQINKDTVVISINSPDGGAVDTLTLTGDYIEDLLV